MTSDWIPYESKCLLPLRWIDAVETYTELSSTNSAARARITQGCPAGTVLRAVRQTKGRGRMGRQWFDHTGSLAFSILWPLSVGLPEPISLILGAAAVQALQPWVPDIRVKWPNDLWIGECKVSGMLGESFLIDNQRWLVFGMGLNVNGHFGKTGWQQGLLASDAVQEELATTVWANRPTSLEEAAGRTFNLENVLTTILTGMDVFLTEYSEHRRELQGDMDRFGNFLGRAVTVRTSNDSFSGVATEVLPDGTLVVQTGTEFRPVRAGDVSLRPFID